MTMTPTWESAERPLSLVLETLRLGVPQRSRLLAGRGRANTMTVYAITGTDGSKKDQCDVS